VNKGGGTNVGSVEQARAWHVQDATSRKMDQTKHRRKKRKTRKTKSHPKSSKPLPEKTKNMYGEQAAKLVTDAKRTQNLPTLPPYASITIQAVTKEVRDLDKENALILSAYSNPSSSSQSSNLQSSQIKSSFNPSEDPATACSLMVNHLSMRRNKRCLLAYHRTRTDKLEEMIWNGQDVLGARPASASTTGPGNDATSSLSAEEEQYVHQYSELLAQYKGQWTDIDLTGSLEPPQDIFVDVRVLRDAGEIQTEYGSLNLTKNSQFFVRKGDVESLIQQGYVQVLR
jgi:GINS complex subunit 1